MNQNSKPRSLDGDLGYSGYLGRRRHAVILGFPKTAKYESFLVYRGIRRDINSVCRKLREYEKDMEFLQYPIPNNLPLEGIFDGKIHQLPQTECRKVLETLKPLQTEEGGKNKNPIKTVKISSSYPQIEELSSILCADNF